MGRGRGQLAGVLGQQVVQGVGALRLAAGDDHRDGLAVAGQGLADLGEQVQVGHHRPGLAVGQR